MSKTLTIGKPQDLAGVLVALVDLEKNLNRAFDYVLKVAGQIGGAAQSPYILGIRETGGPTLLTIGAVPDGTVLMRVGATVVGGGASAPSTATYVTVSSEASLSNERSLSASSPLQLTDAGANASIAVGFQNQLANKVLAGPTGGGAAAPSFRALVSADLPGGAGAPVLAVAEVSLGAVPSCRRSGRVQITGLAGLTIGKDVLVQQAAGPYTGKGTRADEAEMDAVSFVGKVTSAATIDLFWASRYRVRGNVKVVYLVSA